MKNIKLIHRVCFVFLPLLFVSLVHAALPLDLIKEAESGKASAQYSIARSYELGNRVKSDNAKAISWYEKAVNQGHTDAAYRLGLIYYKGVGGFKIDFKKAFYYLSLAAKNNHKNSQANLARMYQNGDGVKRNKERSDYWYEQAFTAKIQPFSEYIKEQAQSRLPKTAPAKIIKKPVVVVKKPWKPSPAKVVKKSKIIFPATITKYEWLQRGKASAYLNSAVTQCKVRKQKLICSSEKLRGIHFTGIYKYKVRSIITVGRNAKNIQITYRKLYTSVPEENIGGYDDDENDSPQTQQLVVGWEQKSHSINCRFETAKSILCRPVGEDAFYIKAR